MDVLGVLYDHYKETYNLSKEAQSRRNKSFLVLCVLEAFSFLILIRPEKALELFLNRINNEFGATMEISNTIVQTLLWLIITYVMIRYVQDTLYVERQYLYLSQLETTISKDLNGKVFSREGDSYLNDYPIVLNFIDLYYKTLMPILFVIINSVRIYNEWINIHGITLAIACDTVLYISIFIIMLFYFFEIHPKTTELIKKYIPFVNNIFHFLRKILKDV